MDDAEKYPSQLAERFQVRLPDGMRDRLREAAEANNRSMNAEIVARLEHSLSRYVSVDDDLSVVPKRDSALLKFMGRAEKMYNDLCEKIEEGNRRIEEENDRLRQELKDIKEKNDMKSTNDDT